MRASTATVWASLVGLGLVLRPQLFGVSPLFPSIQAELGVPFSVVGLLVTVPVLAMGLASFAAPRVAARLDIVRTATLSLVVLAAAGLVRAGMPGMAGLLLLSIPIGAASGIGGIVLPMIAKAAIPSGRVAAATGAYTASLQLGGAIAAALMIPIALAAGGWRASLAAIAVATGAMLVVWLVIRPRRPLGPIVDPSAASPAPVPIPAGPGAAARWLRPTVAAFALMVLLFQGLNAWLPALLVERGWTEADAGSLVAALVLAQIPGTLVAGVLADRVGARRTYVAAAAVVVLAAVLLLALGVDGTWAWTLTAGFALGVIAPILLVLPLDFGADPHAVARSTATILGTGYALASVGPFAMGLVRDLTGSFTLSMLVLGGVAVGLLVVALAIPGHPQAIRAEAVPDG